MSRYQRECRDLCQRLLPTAGVCDQRVGVRLRLLPTAGVCNQHWDPVIDLCPPAFVCHQLLGISLQVYQAYIRFPATAQLEEPSRLSLTASNYSWPCPFWAKDQESMLLEGNLRQIFTVVKDNIGQKL